jgi:hypothetical protein
MRQQPGGVYDYVSIHDHPADVWFVGSAVGTASDAAGFGRNPDAPFATLNYAVSQCTDSVGDVIYVLPGHTETISEAGGLDLDIIGITIIGLGNGTLMPTITMDTDAAVDVDVDAANITVRHIKFAAGVADIVAAIDVNADDFTMIDCQFIGDSSYNALIWIQDALATASDRITIRDCYCNDQDTSNTHFFNMSGTGSGHRVINNVLIGDWGTMAVGGAGIVTDVEIAYNKIWNVAAVNDTCIGTAMNTGFIYDNYVVSPQAQANAITAANVGKFNNYQSVDTEDLSGALEPVVT